MKNFPERLKKAMRFRGLRQTDLAEKTGIEHGTISNYINGKYKPKARNIILIAEALKVNTPWLLGEEDVPMEVEPNVEYLATEIDNYKTTYIKLEYSDLVEMNISREEWNVLYDEFDILSENFKADILKYMYLVFTMDEIVNIKKSRDKTITPSKENTENDDN